jgi:hypothetical protein
LKIEAISIGNSMPAALLTLIVGPTDETRDVGVIRRDRAERHSLRYEFFDQLLDYARTKTPLHSNMSPSDASWVGTSAGVPGYLSYVVRQHDSQVELYIDRGKGSEDENERIFRALEANRSQIEDVYGDSLNWEILDGRRACRISKQFELGGYRDREEWPKIFEVMVDAMTRLETAVRPYIRQIWARQSG